MNGLGTDRKRRITVGLVVLTTREGDPIVLAAEAGSPLERKFLHDPGLKESVESVRQDDVALRDELVAQATVTDWKRWRRYALWIRSHWVRQLSLTCTTPVAILTVSRSDHVGMVTYPETLRRAWRTRWPFLRFRGRHEAPKCVERY